MKLKDRLISLFIPNFKAYHYPPPLSGFLVIKAGEIGVTNDRKHFTLNDIKSTESYIKSRSKDKLVLIDLCNCVQVEGTNQQLIDYLHKRDLPITKEQLGILVYGEKLILKD